MSSKNQILGVCSVFLGVLIGYSLIERHSEYSSIQKAQSEKYHQKLQSTYTHEQETVSVQQLLTFLQWRKKHNKKYKTPVEQAYRMQIFFENYEQIRHHNQQPYYPQLTYSLGLNQFSDLTKEEYVGLLRLNTELHQKKSKRQLKIDGITLDCTGTITISPNPPDEVDWSGKAMTKVLNQGQCGSSYAISAIGALEGIYALRVGKLQTFSVQQVLDCSGPYGNEGCFGGFMDQAFWYLIDHGAATSKSYPNKNDTADHKCIYTKSMRVASVGRCADVPSGNYKKLESAVVQQPVSVAIDAAQLQHYEGGIYNGNCSENALNQAMLIVGYGEEDNQTYWKLKNSMGTSWGESGMFYLQRDLEDGPGKCGVQVMPVVPQNLG